jgi:hypothetical protein
MSHNLKNMPSDEEIERKIEECWQSDLKQFGEDYFRNADGVVVKPEGYIDVEWVKQQFRSQAGRCHHCHKRMTSHHNQKH